MSEPLIIEEFDKNPFSTNGGLISVNLEKETCSDIS